MVSVAGKNAERRSRVLLGSLPPDFLRVSATVQQQQEAADHQAAVALQLVESPYVQNAVGRLSITVGQAKLVKNYGMTRMDPYVRIRVGHCVYETHTDTNGGKSPRWNKVMQCLLPQGVNSIYLEIYDECSFTMDELIAWTQIQIPQNVMQGETHEDWYPLSGKQGDGAEGMVQLVLSYTTAAAPANPYPMYAVSPLVMVPAYGAPVRATPPVTVYTTPTPVMGVIPPGTAVAANPQAVAVPQGVAATAAPPQAPILSEQELKQIQEMFPNVDKEAIKSIFEANRGNKEETINSLLQVQEN
ncbi:toll-interacting protein-like [Chrysoperla carnea]|uniref:toll-interacting protein-like n=1 Tax=Chrysoperla carnea TaxID=189513 RepID=UPI001D079D94|nr:toll-interacting protein-like [Chrysoperla carnea]